MFNRSNLLMDVKNKRIIFCNSLENLQKHGFFVQNWIEVPMIVDQGFIEFQATTPQGILRCVLDTGATWNILHLEGDQTLDEAFQNLENTQTYPWFKIRDQDRGAITFHFLPIRLPAPVEAILGMEFFAEHLVFLDFSKNRIVFSKI